MAVADWNTNPVLNTSIGGVSIAENCPAGNMNDAVRQVMAQARAKFDSLAVFSVQPIANGGTGANNKAEARTNLGALSEDYIGLPQTIRSAGFTYNAPQAGGHVLYTGAASGCIVPHDARSTFPIGSVLTLINGGTGALAILRGADVPVTGTLNTLRWAKDNSNGDRSLAVGGIATIIKIAANLWNISGEGLT